MGGRGGVPHHVDGGVWRGGERARPEAVVGGVFLRDASQLFLIARPMGVFMPNAGEGGRGR